MVSDVDPHWAGHSNSAIAKGFQNGQFKIFQLFNNVPGFPSFLVPLLLVQKTPADSGSERTT